jgi:hypothetical protein
MRAYHWMVVLSGITNVTCVSLCALFHSMFRSECILGIIGVSGSLVRATVVLFLAAAAVALLSNVAFLFRLRVVQTVTRTTAVSSQVLKWKPTWFTALSVQKLILRAFVISNTGTSNKRIDSCPLSDLYESQFHAATFIWDCTVLLTGAWVISCDLNANFTPILRRCAHSMFALCLVVDSISSYIWGNELAGQVSFSLGALEFVIDNQITSCITSQTIIALHFMISACRSREGRGWAFPALKFEFDECGTMMLAKMASPQIQESLKDSTADGAVVQEHQPDSEMTSISFDKKSNVVISAASGCGLYDLLRQRCLMYLSQGLSGYKVFVIPCLANVDHRYGSAFTLARPAFNSRCLRPLQRFADANPERYIRCCAWFLALPDVLCIVFLSGDAKGISTLILNSALLIACLGFLSSRHHNLDRVAVKHVLKSFRFVICAVSIFVAFLVDLRRAYLTVNQDASSRYQYQTSPWAVAAVFVFILVFGLCLLLDCSPNFPAKSQFFISVSA